MTPPPDFLTRLESLMERATKGPWRVDPDDRPGMSWNNHICVEGSPWTICFMAHDIRDNSGQESAAELIVLLRNHAPAIAEVVRAAQEWEAAKHESEGLITTRAQLDRLYNAERRITVTLAALNAGKQEDRT